MLTVALRGHDLVPETMWADHHLLDERVVAVAFDGFPPAATLRTMSDAITRRPSLPILVRGPVEPDAEPLIALASGAAGYVPLEASPGDVGAAVRALLDGEAVLPSSVAAALVRSVRCGGRGVMLHRPDGTPMMLTHREWEVLVLLRQGRTTAEIATRFVVARGTVRTHVSTIVHKLGADDRAALSIAE